eukprot:1181198-Prorocentrum_minimum.AAC.1
MSYKHLPLLFLYERALLPILANLCAYLPISTSIQNSTRCPASGTSGMWHVACVKAESANHNIIGISFEPSQLFKAVD